MAGPAAGEAMSDDGRTPQTDPPTAGPGSSSDEPPAPRSTYEVVLCHRGRGHLSRRELVDHFRGPRSRLVSSLREPLGFEGYHRTVQARRYNPLYLGIRASRSWLVTTLFTLLGGLGIRPKPDAESRRAERWEVVEELVYPSEEALLEALGSEAGRDAARRLAQDHRPHTQRTAALVAECYPVVEASPAVFPRTTTLFFLRSPRGLSRERMLGHWGTSHKRLFVSLQKRLGYVAYDQMHVRSGARLQRAVEAFGGHPGEEFDGVAKVVYRNQRAVLKGFVNPLTQIANVRLIRDEVTFIDAARSSLVFGRENHPLSKGDPR